MFATAGLFANSRSGFSANPRAIVGGRLYDLAGNLTAIPAQHGLKLVNIACSNGTEQANVFTTSNHPDKVVFVFHSFSGNKDEITVNPALSALLSMQNAVVICPDLYGPAGQVNTCGSPAQLRRALDVIRWAEATYGVAPGNVRAAGVSGGAGLGPTFMGVYPNVISKGSFWNGYFDLIEWYNFSVAHNLGYDPLMRSTFGGPPTGALAATYTAQSPSGVIAGTMNCVVNINNGLLDTFIPPSQRTEMRDAYLALPAQNGVTCNYFELANQGHIIDWPTAVAQIA